VPRATLGLPRLRTKKVRIPCLFSEVMRQALHCPSARKDCPLQSSFQFVYCYSQPWCGHAMHTTVAGYDRPSQKDDCIGQSLPAAA